MFWTGKNEVEEREMREGRERRERAENVSTGWKDRETKEKRWIFCVESWARGRKELCGKVNNENRSIGWKEEEGNEEEE